MAMNPPHLIIFVFALLIGVIHAADISYTGVPGGEWATSSNWAGAAYPSAGDVAVVDTIVNLSVAAPNNLDAIRIGANGTGRLQIGSQATLKANATAGSISKIGDGSANQGYVQQEGGTVELNQLEIGSHSASGTYHIHSGNLAITRESLGYSLYLGSNTGGTTAGNGTFRISSGSFNTRAGVHLGSTAGGVGHFEVIGSHPGPIAIGSLSSLDGRWTQHAGSTLRVRIDKTLQGVSPIFVDDAGDDGSGGHVTFENGALLDVDFTAAFLNGGTFTVMEWEGNMTDNGLRFAPSVDTNIWSFQVDVANKRLTVTAAGNPISRNFVHPGLAHKRSDLERMRDMVAADIEPYATTFVQLRDHPRAKYTIQPGTLTDAERTVLDSRTRRFLINDGTSAYLNALMWMITEDSRHADAAVRIFNAWAGLKKNTDPFALNAGRYWRLIEAAEIIKSTYPGWAPVDVQNFKDMLVYPGYSNTTVPSQEIANSDVTIYWRAYQGDPARHGNQGLFAMRTVMAIGVFTDNEIMYDRALRYLQGAPARTDDIPYPSGPSIADQQTGSFEHFDEFRRSGQANTESDHGYNEVIHNYIWPNGQGQEFSRDMWHGLAGVSIICSSSEIAWNQGDDLYGHLDKRPLLGLEYFYRYNLSFENSFPDQPAPWEPRVENGEYIQRLDRSGRWFSLKPNPFLAQNVGPEYLGRGSTNILREPVYEMNLGHYRDRLGVPSEDTKWLQRGHNLLTEQIGVEPIGTVGDHPSYGGLTFHRTSPGDPIQGFANGVPDFAMNSLPLTIEAENYDYFPIDGQGRTYHDLSENNSGSSYRPVDGVDLRPAPDGGHALTSIEAGEWVTYTISVPETGSYDVKIRYASTIPGGDIQFSFDGVDVSGEVSIPHGTSGSTGASDWQDLVIAVKVPLRQGVQALRVNFGGASHAFELDAMTIDESPPLYVVTTTTSDTPPTVSNTDLAQTHYLSSSATGGNAVSTRHAELFNGIIGNNSSGAEDTGVVRMSDENTLTVVLDTSVNMQGYDITEITSVFGWNTAAEGRSNQGYGIILTFVDGSTATLAGPSHWEPNNPAAYWTTVSFESPTGGHMASGVKAITFDITENANAGGVITGREFDIFGTPTLPARTALEAWRFANFGSYANAGTAADSFDADSDGVPNLLEYASGLNPNAPSEHRVLDLQFSNANPEEIEISFYRIADPSLTYTCQRSNSLPAANWIDIHSTAGTENGSVTIRESALPSLVRQFFRLEIGYVNP